MSYFWAMTSMTQEAEIEGEVLRQDSKGRVRTPVERREALLSEYERSGMSAAAFSRQIGVNYQTFFNWVRKKRLESEEDCRATQAGGQGAEVSWLEARVDGIPGVGAGPDNALVVEFPAGVRMMVGDGR